VAVRDITLDSPTDVVALDDGSMLIVDRVRVLHLIPDAGGFKPVWQWPSGTRGQFGTTDDRGDDLAHVDGPHQIAVIVPSLQIPSTNAF
jgi:hypothetical protein